MAKQTRNSSRSRSRHSLRAIGIAVLALGASISACKSSAVREDSNGSTSPAASVSEVPVNFVPVEVEGADRAFEVSLSTRTAKDGSLVEVLLKPLVTLDPLTIRVAFEGTDFPVFEKEKGTYASLVVIGFNTKPRESKIEVAYSTKGGNSKRSLEFPLTVVDGNYRSEVLKVQEEKVNPPKRVIKRIMAEQKEIGALYRVIEKKRYWKGPFALPIQSEVTSPFGNKRLYNGSMKSFHQGLDLRARTPTPIHAPEGAVVAMAKDLYFTGNTVILDHGYGLFTIYGHMSKLDVKKGDTVEKGQLLGLSGMTGRASGPHLHWGAVLMKQKFNPQDLVQVLR